MRTSKTTSGNNADAVLKFPCTGNAFTTLEIVALSFSYNGVPTSGELLVQDADATGTVDGSSATLLDLDVTSAGAGPFLTFIPGNPGRGICVTLKAAGGVGVTGKVNATIAG